MDDAEQILNSISAFAGVTRRKMPVKFYAVRNGVKPGIYHNWDDCLAQVKGYKAAVCRSAQTCQHACHARLTTAQSNHSPV